jgi:hypothetical protein
MSDTYTFAGLALLIAQVSLVALLSNRSRRHQDPTALGSGHGHVDLHHVNGVSTACPSSERPPRRPRHDARRKDRDF